jgi:hypothetical protein
MYEFISKTLKDDIFHENTIKKHHLSMDYVRTLKHYADTGRHTMKVKEYILKHNELIRPFNQFLMSEKDCPPIEEYHIDSFELSPTQLNLSKVINQFHIIKLYEQFSIMQIHGHVRSLLRLQMFFENSIRYHADEYIKEFSHLINSPKIMKNFTDYISDCSFSNTQQKTFVSEMMDLNKIRNKIKKNSDYKIEINIDKLEKYAMLISQKLEQEILAYDKPVFTSTQALLEYRNGFRELSFDYRYQVYKRLKDGVFTSEIADVYQSDLAYQYYIIETIMEGLKMKQINDFEKVFQTIDQFEEIVNQLSKISEQYSDVKETFDQVTNNIKDFNDLNKKMNILSQVNFDKLSQFVNVQDEFTEGIKLSHVLKKFQERTEDIKDINQQVKELKKTMQLLQNKLNKELEK